MTIWVLPFATGKSHFGEGVATVRHRVRADKKDEDLRIPDGSFDLLIVACAGREIVAIEKDFAAAAPEGERYRFSRRLVFRRIRQEDFHWKQSIVRLALGISSEPNNAYCPGFASSCPGSRTVRYAFIAASYQKTHVGDRAGPMGQRIERNAGLSRSTSMRSNV